MHLKIHNSSKKGTKPTTAHKPMAAFSALPPLHDTLRTLQDWKNLAWPEKTWQLEEESEKRAFVGCMVRRGIMTRRSYTSCRSDCSDGGADDAAQRTSCAPFARSSSTHVWWPACAAKESGVPKGVALSTSAPASRSR